MKMNLYSVRDKLVGFTGPIAFQDDKIAIRWFESFCREKKERELTEPKYYDLYQIGTFDPETADITSTNSHQPELIREGENL